MESARTGNARKPAGFGVPGTRFEKSEADAPVPAHLPQCGAHLSQMFRERHLAAICS